eukprot:TRINITY_DN15282_c0_g1_i2.p1 TRINITY_DN15282_c0_g1~~TRINITY_DN15282_c0_g1_i2.p1  ORF type:complete len:407 (-),score=25.79 TRINITY_DN15282_c0_g1_i2:106-1326(-)
MAVDPIRDRVTQMTLGAVRKWPCDTQPCTLENGGSRLESSTSGCAWSEWSEWSQCSGGCGASVQLRTRSVVLTDPIDHTAQGTDTARPGQSCDAPTVQPRECSNPKCLLKVQDCVLSDWSAWSECSAGCAGGWQTSTRWVHMLPKNGGRECPHPLHRSQECNTAPCAVNCVVGAWASWSLSGDCSHDSTGDCVGQETRVRPVLLPAQHDGQECPDLKQNRDCTQTMGCKPEPKPPATNASHHERSVKRWNHEMAAALQAKVLADQRSLFATRMLNLQRMRHARITAKAVAAVKRLTQAVSRMLPHKEAANLLKRLQAQIRIEKAGQISSDEIFGSQQMDEWQHGTGQELAGLASSAFQLEAKVRASARRSKHLERTARKAIEVYTQANRAASKLRADIPQASWPSK